MRTRDLNTCQQCGTVIKRLSEFGNHKDGSINTDYCNQCYQEGVLIERQDSSVKETKKKTQIIGRIGRSRQKTRELAKSLFPHTRKWKESVL